MAYIDLTCDLCSARLTGVEPCDPPIQTAGGGQVLWCTFVCEGPEHHRWSAMVDTADATEEDTVRLVPEIRHRRAKDELSLRSILHTVAGVQELVMLVARIEVHLVKAVSRLEQHVGLANAEEGQRLRQLIEGVQPLLREIESDAAGLGPRASDASGNEPPELA